MFGKGCRVRSVGIGPPSRWGMSRIVCWVLLTWKPIIAEAAEIIPEWTDPRAEAVGGAYGPIVNDENAAYSNPAGLANSHSPRSKDKLHRFVFPGLVIQADDSLRQSLKKHKRDINASLEEQAAQTLAGSSRAMSVASYTAVIFGASKRPTTFLLGFPVRSWYEWKPSEQDGVTTLQQTSFSMYGVNVGVAGRSAIGRVSAGLVARPHLRSATQTQWTQADQATTKELIKAAKSKSTRSTFIPVDVGFLFTAADFWLPTLSIAARNIPTGCISDYTSRYNGKVYSVCGTKGSYTSETGEFQELRLQPAELRGGFSISPRFKISSSQRMNLRLSGEVYPIPVKSGSNYYGEPELPLNRLLHAGAEVSFGSIFDEKGIALFGGLRKGQTSYGISLQMLGLALQYSSFLVDVGTDKEPQIEKRHLLGFGIDF